MTPHDPTPSLLWTPADLAGRWQCSVSTVLRRVRERGVPYLWLGRGEPRFGRRGRPLVRFRPSDVEQWEAGETLQWEVTAAAEQDGQAPARVRAQGLARGKNARVRD